MVFRLDPKKFSDYPPEADVDGSEIIPIVKDGQNSAVTIEKIRAGTDKNFEKDFTNSAFVEVEHNLGKKPSVTVMDSAGDQVIGDVNYVDDNNLVVTFGNSFSGVIICN